MNNFDLAFEKQNMCTHDPTLKLTPIKKPYDSHCRRSTRHWKL